jgi:hypothetical protein
MHAMGAWEGWADVRLDSGGGAVVLGRKIWVQGALSR